MIALLQLPYTHPIRQSFLVQNIMMTTLAYLVMMAVLFIVQNTLQRRGNRRLIRRLIESRCQLCPFCGYNLQGRAHDQLACPECSYQISRRECVRRWCVLLRTRLTMC